MSNYIDMSSVTGVNLNGVEVESIASNGVTLWEKSGNVIEPFNIKNISQNVATVDWNTNADNRNLQYSTDKTNWTNVPYANGKYTLTIPVGTKYYVQGNSTNFGGWWGSDEDVEIGGYILSLHYPSMEQPSSQIVRYTSLFSKNGNGTANGKLHFNFATLKIPVKRLGSDGANSMFYGCTSITSLEHDIFYSDDDTYRIGERVFYRMFQGCKNLTTVNGFNMRRFPNLSNWHELQYMFYGCSSLEYVADNFFDTTVTPQTGFFRDTTCAYMFQNCTSLIHPPKLPTVRSNGQAFLQMFQGCTSLTSANTANIMPSYTGIGTSGGEYAMSNMFKGMFYGCTGLTSMHDLSSYTMGGSGNSYFNQMYSGCTGITSIEAAKMPSGVATTNCFREMFKGCTGITSVPSGFIKPTNTAESCYQDMFNGCTSLTTIPSGLIQATDFAKSCCAYMFYNCSSLTGLPSGLMTVSTVSEGSCSSMFESSGISSIPSGLLQAATLAKNCYSSMFRSCGNLTTVPTDLLLSAKTMAEGCYTIMFQYSGLISGGLHLGATDIGTSSFANWWLFDAPFTAIEVDFKEWTSATSGWMVRCASSGVFTKYEALPEIYDTDHIPVGWTVVNKYASEAPTITHDDTDIIIVNNTYNAGGVIYYTTDGSTPTSASNVYTQPFLGVIGQTIKAICIYHDITSEVTTWVVAASQLPTPSISGNDASVTITNNDTTGTGLIYYTIDGTTPSSASTLYSQPFTVSSGTTVKAICVNNTGSYFYTDSDVISKIMYDAIQLPYVHNQTMSGSPNVSTMIDTNIIWDNTIKFRYKGKYVGYDNGNITIGVDMGLRWFIVGNNVYYDWVGRDNAAYNLTANPLLDFTVGNKYVYNNNTQSYLFNVTPRTNSTANNLIVDVTAFWFDSLQIWKTINNVETLVFDGYAAELNGEYGIFDAVSGTLKTNSTITIVGETE